MLTSSPYTHTLCTEVQILSQLRFSRGGWRSGPTGFHPGRGARGGRTPGTTCPVPRGFARGLRGLRGGGGLGGVYGCLGLSEILVSG